MLKFWCHGLLTAAWVAGALAAAPVHAQNLAFSDHGKALAPVMLDEVRAFNPKTVKVFEPHEEREIEFEAVALEPILDRGYGGGGWRKAAQVLFVCADGYKAPVDVSRIRDQKAWLAFARKGTSDFSLTEKETKKKKALGPLFLVWETNAASKTMGKQGWPFQVVGIDLIDVGERYPGLVPAGDAPATVRAGYKLFINHCVSCHALGGQGGKVGPELGSPVSVTTYYKEEWLKRWIADPSSIRTGTSMAAPFAPGPDRARKVDEVVAYLKAMAARK